MVRRRTQAAAIFLLLAEPSEQKSRGLQRHCRGRAQILVLDKSFCSWHAPQYPWSKPVSIALLSSLSELSFILPSTTMPTLPPTTAQKKKKKKKKKKKLQAADEGLDVKPCVKTHAYYLYTYIQPRAVVVMFALGVPAITQAAKKLPCSVPRHPAS